MSKVDNILREKATQIVSDYEINIANHKKNLLNVLENLSFEEKTIKEKKQKEIDRIEAILVRDISDLEEKRIKATKDKDFILEKAESSLKESNSVCNLRIKQAKEKYANFISKTLDSYDKSNNTIIQNRAIIQKKVNKEAILKIESLEKDNLLKQKMIEKSSIHLENELKTHKDFLVNKASEINEKIKGIKEFYIHKDEEIKKERDEELRALDHKIKVIQTQFSEKLKPILLEFKSTLETLDKDAFNIRKKSNSKRNKVTLNFDKAILKISSSITSAKYNYKRLLKGKSSETNLSISGLKNYINQKQKEITKAKKNKEKAFKEINRELNIELANIRLKQKIAEINKNKEISNIRILSDNEVAIIQEQIKYTNGYYEILLKNNQVEEMTEISKMEYSLHQDELKKEKDDRFTISDYSFFKNDYLTKIELNNTFKKSLSNTEAQEKNFELLENEYECKLNDTLNNLSIEKAKIERDYVIAREENNIKHNISLYELAKKNAIENEQSIADVCDIKEKIAQIEYQKRITNLTKNTENQLYKNSFNISDEKIKYNLNTKFEKTRRLIRSSDAEHQTIASALLNLRQSLSSKNTLLNHIFTVYTKNLEPNEIIKKIIDITNAKIEETNSTMELIIDIINNRIDLQTSFKYNALKSDILESFNEANEKLKKSETMAINNIENTKVEIKNIDYQILYTMHDYSALRGKRNLLIESKNKERIKGPKSQDVETLELNAIKKSMANINNQINSLKKEKGKKNLTLQDQNKDLQKLREQIKYLENETNQKLDSLVKQRHSEMHIYYTTIDSIKQKTIFVTQAFNQALSRMQKHIEAGLNKAYIQKIISVDEKNYSSAINGMSKLINNLRKTVNSEQNIRLSNYEKNAFDDFFKNKRDYNVKISKNEIRTNRLLEGYQIEINKQKKNLERISSETNTNKIINEIALKKQNSLYTKGRFEINDTCRRHLKAIDDNIFYIKSHYQLLMKNLQIDHQKEYNKSVDDLQKKKSLLDDTLKNHSSIHDKDLLSVENQINIRSIQLEKSFNKEQALFKKQITESKEGIKALNKLLSSSLQEIELEKVQTIEELNMKYNYDLQTEKRNNRNEVRVIKHRIFRFLQKK